MPEESAFIRKLRCRRRARVRLIIRTTDNPNDHLDEIRQAGLEVRRTLRLVRAVAVEGPADAALKLLGRPWVHSLEEDAQVQTQSADQSKGGQA